MSSAAHARITTLAADRALHRAFGWLHLHEPQLRRWQLEFLAIPAPPFHESARANWFLQKFTELGLTNPHIDKAGNALAELNPTSSPLLPTSYFLLPSPVLLLSAHLDTVFPPNTNCTPTEDGPLIHCPGACDNGAGLTALLALAAALRHANIVPATTILFCANVGEEGPGDLRGMKHLFSPASPYNGRIQTAIALEGSGTSTVVDRALGSRRLRVKLSGTGGHSWADAGLPNPILALASCLLAVANLPLPSSPRTTLNVGTISGGTSVNSIPAHATADLDLRSTSSLELDRSELAILTTLETTLRAENDRNTSRPRQDHLKRHKDDLTLAVQRIGDRPSGALAPSSALYTSLLAVDRHLNLRTDPHIGSTDANLPLSRNIPALAIGCGGTATGIHTPHETYNPTGRDLALRRILLLLLNTTDTLSI